MRATQRQFDAGVIQRLLDEPYRFEFFQAVRLIEIWLNKNGLGRVQASSDFLRFENSTSLGFPASEIEAISARTDAPVDSAAELVAALKEGQRAHIRIRPAFMGFLGASGALPLHYTERIAAHQHDQHDAGPRAFLDLFSHRALALFYEAWAKYRVLYRLDVEGKDTYLPLLLALSGIQSRESVAASAEDEIDDQSLAYFAAQLGARVVSGSVLAGVLSEYFAVPVAIEQFAGMWDVLSDDMGTRLGEGNCVVGSGAMIGERIWRSDLNFRVRIGPLSRKEFDRFLPGAAGSRALARLIGDFTTSVPYGEVQVLLRARDVRGASLDGGARLGLDSFIRTAQEKLDRADICYRLPPR